MFLLPSIKVLFVLEDCTFIFIDVTIEISYKDLYRGECSCFMIIMLASDLQIQYTCKGDLFSLMKWMESLQDLAEQDWTLLWIQSRVPCMLKWSFSHLFRVRGSHSKLWIKSSYRNRINECLHVPPYSSLKFL